MEDRSFGLGDRRRYPSVLMAKPTDIQAFLMLDDSEAIDEALENPSFATWVDQNCDEESLQAVVDGVNEQISPPKLSLTVAPANSPTGSDFYLHRGQKHLLIPFCVDHEDPNRFINCLSDLLDSEYEMLVIAASLGGGEAAVTAIRIDDWTTLANADADGLH